MGALADENNDMIAARRDSRDLDIHTVDAAERIHVQLRHEAAAELGLPPRSWPCPLCPERWRCRAAPRRGRAAYSTETRTTPALIMPSALAAGTERIDDPAADKRVAIIDAALNRPATVGHRQHAAERARAVSARSVRRPYRLFP